MKIIRGTIVSSNPENYEIEVNLDYARRTVTAKQLSPSHMDSFGAGFFTNPLKAGQKCLVMEEGYTYWILGYYNETGSMNVNGLVIRDDNILTKLGGGDTLIKHPAGNYIHLTKDQFRINSGSGQKIYSTGGQSNTLDITSYRTHLKTAAGKFSWYLKNNDVGVDVPSLLTWKIKKNYEKFPLLFPSDYIMVRAGSVQKEDNKDAYKNNLFEIDITQYEGLIESSKSYISLSKDDDDSYLTINLENPVTTANTQYKVIDAYNHTLDITNITDALSLELMGKDGLVNLSVSDTTRTADISILGNKSLSINLNNAYILEVDDLSNVDISANGYYYLTNKDIKLGSKMATEPLVLGNRWEEIMLDLISMLDGSTYLHSQGPTTGLFQADKEKLVAIKNKLKNALSNIAKTEKG